MGLFDSKVGKVGFGLATGGLPGGAMAVLSGTRAGQMASLATNINALMSGYGGASSSGPNAVSRRMALGTQVPDNSEEIDAYSQGGAIPSPRDDVPDPDPKKAAEMQKGATKSGVKSLPQYWQNIKSSVGYAEGGKIPGHSPMAGNSSKNDTVEIAVSPGEEVISREDVPVVHEALERRMSSVENSDHAKLFEDALKHIEELPIHGHQKMAMIEPILRAKHFGLGV